jgi:hypothetical protein
LQKNGVKYWLQDGTLLGYYRERDLISHDNDTDIGLFWSDILSNKVFLDIIEHGFVLYKIKGYMEDSLMLTFTKDEQKVDLFFYYYSSDGRIYHTALGKHWRVVNYFYHPFEVKEVNFLGYFFYVPCNEHDFIVTKYGDEWHIPKAKWDNINSPENATVTDKFVDIKQCKKEFRHWLRK